MNDIPGQAGLSVRWRRPGLAVLPQALTAVFAGIRYFAAVNAIVFAIGVIGALEVELRLGATLDFSCLAGYLGFVVIDVFAGRD